MIMIFKRSSAVIVSITILIAGITILLGHRLGDVPASALPVYASTIVVDAGHGEPDGGCVAADGTKEAGLNLAVSQKLAGILSQSGSKVIMTRTTEEGMFDTSAKSVAEKKKADMYKRRDIQKNAGADFFVSVHMNKFEQSKYSGAQVVYDTKNPESKALATYIQTSLRENVDPENKREPMAAQSGIFLLKNAPIPSVIVECGFLSNSDELAKLKTEDYQNKIAWAIYSGICKYYEQNGAQQQ